MPITVAFGERTESGEAVGRASWTERRQPITRWSIPRRLRADGLAHDSKYVIMRP